jgi:hypothetical protein
MIVTLTPVRKEHKVSRLGVLIPAVLLLTALADLGLRFAPPKLFAFRAWEAMMLFVTADGPFVPNQQYYYPHAFGDLPNLANLPAFRQYRREVFTTDAHGFRNRLGPGSGQPPPRIVLLGDSFAAGAGVADEDTLSEQLGRLQAAPVYNAALCAPDFAAIRACIGASGVSHGLVIWQVSGRRETPAAAAGEIPAPRSVPDRLNAALVHALPTFLRREVLAHRLGDDLRYSPLKILATSAYRTLQNDKILPNRQESAVSVYTLRNGQPMLFLAGEVKHYYESPPVDPTYAIELNRRVEAMGDHLLALLVPEKFAVYCPLLQDAPTLPAPPVYYLDRLEASLSGAGLTVVNLTSVFRASAAQALSEGRYLYWLDDTHWNESGIRLAAEQLASRSLVRQVSPSR